MRVEQGFAKKTRVVKIKGRGKGRRGLIIETDLLSGAWLVLFDGTRFVYKASPYEFEYDKIVE